MTEADYAILIAEWCKRAATKSGEPDELIKEVEHIAELTAELKARREKK